MKKCARCSILQTSQCFSPNKKAKDKLASWCKKCSCIINKIYKDSHKEQEKERGRLYRLENKEKLREKNRKSASIYQKFKYKNDPMFKLMVTIRNRLGKFIIRKSQKTLNIIGCSKKELFDYMESKFQLGMTWQNHGINGWHIDHIKPLSSAKTELELYELCHYSNLQPLWAIDNLRKSNKIE